MSDVVMTCGDEVIVIRGGELDPAVVRSDALRGRNPRHFTVAFDDLDKGVEALCSCKHLVWQNPYHEE
jgi:hypothetical protein